MRIENDVPTRDRRELLFVKFFCYNYMTNYQYIKKIIKNIVPYFFKKMWNYILKVYIFGVK